MQAISNSNTSGVYVRYRQVTGGSPQAAELTTPYSAAVAFAIDREGQGSKLFYAPPEKLAKPYVRTHVLTLEGPEGRRRLLAALHTATLEDGGLLIFSGAVTMPALAGIGLFSDLLGQAVANERALNPSALFRAYTRIERNGLVNQVSAACFGKFGFSPARVERLMPSEIDAEHLRPSCDEDGKFEVLVLEARPRIA